MGDCLIRAVERWGVARGATTLRLSVMPDNGAAIALYERNGFAEVGEPGGARSHGAAHERALLKRLGAG